MAQFVAEALEVIIDGPRCDLKKISHLLLEQDTPSLKDDPLDPRSLFYLGYRIRIVEDVLPIQL